MHLLVELNKCSFLWGEILYCLPYQQTQTEV